MKHVKSVLIVFVVLICTISGTLLGCDSGGETPKVIGEDSIEFEMLKRIPDDLRNFAFVDLQEMRSDPELVIYLDEGEGPTAYLNTYVELGDVDQMMVVSHVEGLWLIPPLQIVAGDFNLDNVRDLLSSERYTEHEYEGVEIWDIEIDDYRETVVIMDDNILIGHTDVIRNSIQADQGTKSSLYDDINFREVLGRLPPGLSVACNEGVFLGQYTYDGLLVSGLSVAKKSEGLIELTWVCKFTTEQVAKDTMDTIRNDVLSQKYFDFRNVFVTQEGQFVRVVTQTSVPTYFGEEIEEE